MMTLLSVNLQLTSMSAYLAKSQFLDFFLKSVSPFDKEIGGPNRG